MMPLLVPDFTTGGSLRGWMSRLVCIAALGCVWGGSLAGAPEDAALLGRWSFDELGSPYSETTGNASDFLLDVSTAVPARNVGVLGYASGVRWAAETGQFTRLATYGAAVDRDSFGFSFWVRPVALAPGGSLLGKEMQSIAAGEAFTKVAWQVSVGADDGSGNAPIEFVVRGTDRSEGDFFGSVLSPLKVPLYSNSVEWVHLAGGYDSASGELRLIVNGVGASADGTPGADNSDGGALTIGTMVNGSGYVVSGASADYDDLRYYDGLLSVEDVRRIFRHPELSVLRGRAPQNFDGQLVAHWKLNDASPPYADWSGHMNDLEQDYSTASPAAESGVEGGAQLLRYEELPGVSTRLYADGDALQTDSFGFSFWLRPDYLNVGENVIAKEMPPVAGEGYTRMAWHVQVGLSDGSGLAPLELVVRGSDRADGDFFGSVNSSVLLPLATASSKWVHVAGGYDSFTGDLSIYVDGVATYSAGTPGANNSDGSWFSVGSVRNGTEFVAYAATAAIDDIQLYSRPLSSYAVAYLGTQAGEQFHEYKDLEVTDFERFPDGSVALSFQSIPGWNYMLEATPDLLSTFNPFMELEAPSNLSDVSLAPWMLDDVLGVGSAPNAFFRVRALIPDAMDGDLGLPAAEMTPFLNGSKYVPQYHLSWQYADVGDPCGIIRYNDVYHIFNWDHGVSSDLIHWSSQGWPFEFAIPDSGFWTGSVVVDVTNSSGFGTLQNPPMVAIFTIHNNTTDKEDVGIAYSTNYIDFYEFEGNPVVSTADTVFRDPDVFWDEQMERWVMVVARSEAKQLQFYYSNDLKDWTLMSTFGPEAGATNEIWEVPGLIQVPIRGAGGKKKWVLHCGGGSNKVQYWVGNFDGTTFTMDGATRAYLENGVGLDGKLFADFEAATYAELGWSVMGDAFGGEPVPRWWGLPGQSHLGDRMASSYKSTLSDFYTGSALFSPEFTITKNCINFLIGGGNHPGQTCINLKIGDTIVRSATGDNSDLLVWKGWNVAEFVGQQATLEIIDDYGGNWGRIYVDQIVFSDVLFNTGREHANWVEYSPDFFAPKFIRDFDGLETDVNWMGWIGNWAYEELRPEPDDWGKGVETLIRKLELEPTPRGYEILQQPIADMQKLRGEEVTIPPTFIESRTMDLAEFQPATNTYELEVEFNLDGTADVFGLNLCADGAGHRVILGYERSSAHLFLDRAYSDYVDLNESFLRFIQAPYKPEGDTLKLRVFVDQSSIEVFTADGREVITAQIYPDVSNTKIEVFSNDGDTTLRRARAWMLSSIW